MQPETVVTDLKTAYGAQPLEDTEQALDAFEGKWGEQSPVSSTRLRGKIIWCL